MFRNAFITKSIASLMLLVATVVIYGCATPSYIEPTSQPGGFQTPGVRFHPPESGVPELPPGFHPCGQYDAPVHFEDGSTMVVFGCMYCADDPNDRTVYVQPNCSGYYRKGIRTTAAEQGQTATVPTNNRLTNVGGNLGEEVSTISFVVVDDLTLEPEILEFSGNMDIDGIPAARWAAIGVTKFAPGRSVTLSGSNQEVASALFWQFGGSGVDALTDLGDSLELRVGYSELLGMVVVPTLNGEVLTDQIDFLPWDPVATHDYTVGTGSGR